MPNTLSLAGFILAAIVATSAVAQEQCYSDGKKTLVDWENTHKIDLSYWVDQMKKTRTDGNDPNSTMITYSGMQMPVSAAYLIVHAKYDADSKVAIDGVVDQVRKCAKDVVLPSAAYDVVRKFLGIDTVLPEAATRVDFAELTAGTVFEGKDALVPKSLEDARTSADKALDDIRKAGDTASKDLYDAFNKARDSVFYYADPKNWRF
jgi:hypothetical protein